MSDDKKQSDPDNVFMTDGKKDPSKVYVFVPFNYRDAQSAIKDAGGTWAGSQWEMDKEKFTAAEGDIRAGARKDIELGKDGRKDREDALKAEKEAAKPSDEDKAAAAEERAKRGREAALERDKTRMPVAVGTVGEGDTMSVNGADVSVARVGKSFTLDEDGARDMAERFPGADVKAGQEIAYASFEAPEARKEADEAPEPDM